MWNHKSDQWTQSSTNMAQALNQNVRELWQKPEGSFVNFPSPHPARADQIPDAQVQ
jgi:hypothetical protein